MKKFFTALTFLVFVVCIGVRPVAAGNNAVLLLTTENSEVVEGNMVYYDLVLNSLGNQINEIDVQFLIRGSFDRQSMTFNLHPQHAQMVSVSSPMTLAEYQPIYENSDGMRVRVVLKAGSKPFNEGSGAIPVFRVGLKTTAAGSVRAYIDSSHSYVRYTSADKYDYDNYTSEAMARVITVLASGRPQPSTTPTSAPLPTATPTATPTVRATGTVSPTPTPTTVYDQEFQRVTQELEVIKNQVAQQDERISFLERLMQRLRSFFGRLFSRDEAAL